MKPLPAVRERTEDYERASLSTWATLAMDTKGRDRHEEPDRLRTAFQCDRDRILHTPEFRRLAGKTSTWWGPQRRTSRLTHALELGQIARTIARGLRLNEDLIEAIALGCDLGAAAFGDAGEEALSVFTDAPFRFNEHSVRVVERLARDGRGLNLTWEVRDGIIHQPWTGPPPATPEGQVVRIANRVTRLTRDLDDARAAGVLTAGELTAEVRAAWGDTRSRQLATLVEDVVATALDQPDVGSSARATALLDRVAAAVTAATARQRTLLARRDRAIHCLRGVAVYALENPDWLPTPQGETPLATRVCDVVAGMTDDDALAAFCRALLPAE